MQKITKALIPAILILLMMPVQAQGQKDTAGFVLDKNERKAYLGLQLLGSTSPYSIRGGIQVNEFLYTEFGFGFWDFGSRGTDVSLFNNQNLSHYELSLLFFAPLNQKKNSGITGGIGIANSAEVNGVVFRAGYIHIFENRLLIRGSISGRSKFGFEALPGASWWFLGATVGRTFSLN